MPWVVHRIRNFGGPDIVSGYILLRKQYVRDSVCPVDLEAGDRSLRRQR